MLLRRYSHPRLRRASDAMQAAAAERATFLEQHLAAMTQIQLLNRTASERRRFFGIQRHALNQSMSWHAAELTFFFSSQVGLMAASTAVLGFGGYEVLQGHLTIGSLMAFYGFVYRVFDPLEMAIAIYANIQRAGASIRRIMAVLETVPTIVDPPRPVQLAPHGPLAVRLRDVRFAYPGKPPTLDGLSLSIQPGEKLALVGISGSGKTSIAKMLTRLYEPTSGRVEIDGVAIDDLRLSALRARVALVPQEPFLFAASLIENLRLAAPTASDEAIQGALTLAQISLSAAVDGRTEEIAQRGGSLSGGERLRVAVARALLQQPRLLILDEATSALDGRTEQRLLAALDRHFEGQVTVLLIAHRLSAIRWADRIVVLHGGRVIATGRHRQLLDECTLYRALCANQLSRPQAQASPFHADELANVETV